MCYYGAKALWEIKKKRVYLRAPNIFDEQGLKVADLEVEFAEMNGYMAETDAEELLLDVEFLLMITVS